MFCIYLRTNTDLCHLQYKLIGFYNQMKSVYSAVRTGSLNKAVCASYLDGLTTQDKLGIGGERDGEALNTQRSVGYTMTITFSENSLYRKASDKCGGVGHVRKYSSSSYTFINSHWLLKQPARLRECWGYTDRLHVFINHVITNPS